MQNRLRISVKLSLLILLGIDRSGKRLPPTLLSVSSPEIFTKLSVYEHFLMKSDVQKKRKRYDSKVAAKCRLRARPGLAKECIYEGTRKEEF